MERSVVTRFDAKVDGYLAGLAKMKAGTESLVKSASASLVKNRAEWNAVGTAAMAAGAVIGVAVVSAAKKYADFEQAMSKVGAVADATARQQKALGEAAIQAGQDTVFSATEAAKAEEELVKAGVSVDDVLGGALRGSLDLAAAGQIDLAKSAEIAAQSMNIFDKSGREVGHIADVLTAGANKSAAGVDDLGMALSQGGLLAKQTGLTFEDTVGVLSAFADNALKGSDAGTSLKTMLQRLTPQSAEQAKAMEQLGLTFYDANGQFVGIAESAGRLETAFRDLTPEQRNAALATIFGSDAVRGANILMEQGESGIRKYIAAVNDQGAAQRMAARQTDNLKGDLEQLSGTLESAFIRGGSGSNDAIRSMVQNVTDLVDKFNQLSPSTQAAVVQVAAVSAGLLIVGGGAIKATTAILSMKASMDAAGVSAARFSTALKGIAAAGAVFAVAAIGSELLKVAPGMQYATVNVDKLAESLRNLSDQAGSTQGLQDVFQDPGFFATDVKSAAAALDEFALSAQIALGNNIGDKIDRVLGGAGVDTFTDQVGQLDGALAKLVRDGNADAARTAYERLIASVEKANRQGANIPVDEVKAKFEAYQAALDETAVSSDVAGSAASGLADDTYAAGKAAQDAADGTKTWADELDQINSPLLDARDAARQFEQAIDDGAAAIKDYRDELIKKAEKEGKGKAAAAAWADAQIRSGKALDITTEAGRKNQAALDGIAKAAIEQIGAMQQNGASQTDLQGKLDTSRARLAAVGEKFGLTKAQAKAYADQVLQIPTSVSTTVSAKTAQAKRDLAVIEANINRLRGLDVRIPVRYVETGPRPGGGRSTAGGITKAGGGSVIGPGSATSDSIPALLSNGEHVWTADEVAKAGGQGAMYRARAAVKAGALKFAHGGAVGYADGGSVDFTSILDILRDVTSYGDVLDSRRTTTSALTALKGAQARLAAANKALAAARRTSGRGDDLKALEARRKALAAIAAQEERVVAAKKAQARVTTEFQRDKRAYIDRATEAAASTNSYSKRFLDNIDRLISMGFKSLALDLLDQGGPEAVTLADQAVKSVAKARALQSQLSTSSALSNRADAIRAMLTGDASGGAPAPLSFYEQLRDLRPSSAGAGAVQQVTIDTTINGAVDPVGTVLQLEKLLQGYTNRTGQPVRFDVAPTR